MTMQIHGAMREALSPAALNQVVYAEAVSDVVENLRGAIVDKMSENDEALTQGLAYALTVMFDYKSDMWVNVAKRISQDGCK